MRSYGLWSGGKEEIGGMRAKGQKGIRPGEKLRGGQNFDVGGGQ